MTALPTLYEYYTFNGINSGLSDSQSYFTLNNRNITVLSGSVHYFRVPQPYWRDRLKKLRAAGLNTVETYVPWNLHEPQIGFYEFGNSGTDYQELLDVEKFLKMAKEEDLFVIVRPGPYICAEWEFGGLPSWLLRNNNIKMRTSDPNFMSHVERYFSVLLKILALFQFQNNGPIIAFQVENEYGNTNYPWGSFDSKYLAQLKDLFIKSGIKELLFTSDTPIVGKHGSIPNVLYAANFQILTLLELTTLNLYQHFSKPLMVSEYWSGWFTEWGQQYQTRSVSLFSNELKSILKSSASVNFYMFHGGSNWAFMNGASASYIANDNLRTYIPLISSYDYDAPLSENGDYTPKYYALVEIIKKYNPIKTLKPQRPEIIKPVQYPEIRIQQMLTFNDIVNQIPNIYSNKRLLSMEQLPLNNNSGQQYGYIIYRKKNVNIPMSSILTIEGVITDTLMVLINGKLVSEPLKSLNNYCTKFGFWKAIKNRMILNWHQSYTNATMDLVVENWGRVHFGRLNQFNLQKKGLWQGDVLLNGQKLYKWDHIPLEFKHQWTTSLRNWRSFSNSATVKEGPKIYKANLNIVEKLTDTFLDMRDWIKGIVILNGFPLSRYYRIGPQQTIYVPGAFLKQGKNEILIFEHFFGSNKIKFSTKHIYETIKRCLVINGTKYN